MSSADLNAMARRVIDSNHYMTLGTLDPDGRPRLSPVYYTPADYARFYWVSVPEAHHSRNVEERPEIEIVIYDSSAAVGDGEAVYIGATAGRVPDEELDAVIPEAFRTKAGASSLEAEELRGEAKLRLYVARARSYEVHIAGDHPEHGRGADTRQPAEPA